MLTANIFRRGPRERVGTTYTPSSRRYAKDSVPHITQRNSGLLPSGSFAIISAILRRFSAASSVRSAVSFILKASQRPSGSSMTASIPLPLPSL